MTAWATGLLVAVAPGTVLAAPVVPPQTVVGDKLFTESRIIAQLYGQALAARGLVVGFESFLLTEEADAAVRDGSVSIYPEYTGTALTVVLRQKGGAGSAANFRRIAAAYRERGLTAIGPSPYVNDNRVACRPAVARREGLATLSDVARAAPRLVYSGNNQHLVRRDGYPLLRRAYGIRFKRVIVVPLVDRYRAIERRTADCVYAFGTDAQISRFNLRVMRDDRGLFQGIPYENFAVVNTAWLAQAAPGTREVIRAVTRALTPEAVRALNAQVDVAGRAPADVARAFLARTGLPGAPG